MELDAAPATALLLLGFSNTQSSFGALPLGLAAIGMPGCALRVSAEAALPMVGTQPRASLLIPSDPGLVGLTFHVQAQVLASGANPIGWVLSAASTAIVGS